MPTASSTAVIYREWFLLSKCAPPHSSLPNFYPYSSQDASNFRKSLSIQPCPLSSSTTSLCLFWSGDSYRIGTKLEQVQTYPRFEASQRLKGSAEMPEGMPGPWETLLPSLERPASDGSSPFRSSVTQHEVRIL